MCQFIDQRLLNWSNKYTINKHQLNFEDKDNIGQHLPSLLYLSTLWTFQLRACSQIFYKITSFKRWELHSAVYSLPLQVKICKGGSTSNILKHLRVNIAIILYYYRNKYEDVSYQQNINALNYRSPIMACW